MTRPSGLQLLILLGCLAWAIPGEAAEAATPESNLPGRERFLVYHNLLDAAAGQLLTSLERASLQAIDRHTEAQVRESNPMLAESELHRFAKDYWGGRVDDLRQAIGRLRQLRPSLEPILHGEGIPSDLFAVVLIESGAMSTAQSPRGARGLWQFIPATARRYGLTVLPGHDERVNTEKATRAAARYLRDLYLRFGDWPLALVAYNAGEQAVQRAIDRAGSADFWVLSERGLLPEETRQYVAAVLAALELLGNATAVVRPSDMGDRSGDTPVLYATSAVQN